MGSDDPPPLRKNTSYTQWKREVDIWMAGTDVPEKKRAARLFQKMEGKVKQYVSRMSIDDLSATDGVKKVKDHLDEYYKKDEAQTLFLAIEDFQKYRRARDEPIADYIEEFQRRYDIVKEAHPGNEEHSAIPEGLLAYTVLKHASLGENDERLVRATCAQLTYKEMCKALKRCLGDTVVNSSGCGSSGTQVQVKSEPSDAYHARECSSDDECLDTYYQNRNSNGGKFQGSNNRFNNNGRYQNNYGRYQNNSRGYQNNNNNNSDRYQKNDNNQNKGKYPNKYANQYNDSQNKYQGNQRENMKDRRTGEVMRCKVCDSKFHFAKQCPNGNASTMLQSVLDYHQQNILDVSNDYESIMIVLKDTLNRALIDTGATTTVCGSTWLETFLESLNTAQRRLVKEEVRNMTFRFGDGRGVPSSKAVSIPITICGKELMLETFVVDGDLPLLFSRESMKLFGVSLDIQNDKMMIEGRSQDLIVTNSGHYVADLSRRSKDQEIALAEVMLINEIKDAKKTALKIHRFYGHPSSQTLIRRISDSDYNSKELIREIKALDDSCDHCARYKRERSRPKASLLAPSDVNELVSMDLKTLTTGHIMLHVIDLFSRFSATSIIPNKQKETVIGALFSIWIATFGRAKLFLTDNGGEFVNEEFMMMCEDLAIVIKTTAAYAPFSNGVCERHNGIIADSFNKLIEDVKCHPRIALAWATNAKNSLSNTYGFSPYMLVFGRNPSIPGLDNLKTVTTLNESTVCGVLRDHLNCMQQSRLAFVKANNNQRVKRAIAGRICHVEEEYLTGDQVYYKRMNQKRWSGPGTIIGVDGKQVFVRQGGSILRVHVTKLSLRSRADEEIQRSASSNPESEITIDPVVSTEVQSGKGSEVVSSDSSDSESEDDVIASSEREQENVQVSVPVSQSERTRTVPEIETSDIRDDVVDEFADSVEQIEEWTPVQLKIGDKLDVKAGDKIRYQSTDMDSEEDLWKEAIVISRAGKVTGKDKNQFNIQHNNDQSMHHVHLDKFKVEKSKSLILLSHVQYFESDSKDTFVVNVPKERYHDPLIKEAMRIEMDYWKKYNVFTEVNDRQQKAISTRWVVSQKGHNKYKARLVVRGFEDVDVSNTDSPTCEKSSLRILLSLSKAHNWKVESIDIKAAFLQSEELDRIVFVKPPRELKRSGIIWRLNRPAYGLCDSSRNWYISIKSFLMSIGCECCVFDKALFYYKVDGKLCGMIILHVDDFLISGNGKFKNDVFNKVMKKYETSSHEKDSFKYIGINISQNKDFIQLDQYDYASYVEPVQIKPVRLMDKTQLCDVDEKTQYLSLLGKLSWLSYITRPDLKFDVYVFSKCNKAPTIQNLHDLNGIVAKLNIKKGSRFLRLNLKEPLSIIVYTDASFGNLDNRINSGRGYVIFLISEDNACVLTWQSNKVSRVVNAVLDSETLALRDGIRHAEWLRTIVVELLYGVCDENVIKIICYTDSDQLYKTLNSDKQCSNHGLRRDIEIIKEYITKSIVSEVIWIRKEFQLADVLTKAGADSRKLDLVLATGKHTRVL